MKSKNEIELTREIKNSSENKYSRGRFPEEDFRDRPEVGVFLPILLRGVDFFPLEPDEPPSDAFVLRRFNRADVFVIGVPSTFELDRLRRNFSRLLGLRFGMVKCLSLSCLDVVSNYLGINVHVYFLRLQCSNFVNQIDV